MGKQKKVTKATVLRLARNRYGANAAVRFNPGAPTADERGRLLARNKEIQRRLDQISQELVDLAAVRPSLLDAARFVTAVNGDPPSMDQLRDAVARADRAEDLIEERDQLKEEKSRNSWRSIQRRCECVVLQKSPVPHYVVPFTGDTWEELVKRIESTSSVL